jgi:ATP-dependent helicase HrpB
LSTNVAETSVTIEGVSAVVDSGLARIASSSPWTGLPTLAVRRISRASAAQRAGRAGRLGPGRCVRLYSAHDHDTRPEHELPEVSRADLADARLSLAAAAIDVAAFPWLTPPPEPALRAAEALLERLGALDDGGITSLGRRLAMLPLHPRLGRLLIDAVERGAPRSGAAVAALLALGQSPFSRGPRRAEVEGAADLLEDVERLRALRSRGRVDFDRARHEGADLGRLAELERAVQQLERIVARHAKGAELAHGSLPEEEALLRALLSAFPDRVAKRRRPRSAELVFSDGGGGKLDPSSVVGSELLIAYDVSERVAQGGVVPGRAPAINDGVVVRGAARLEADWLLEAQLARVADERDFVWNEDGGRVDEVRRLRYGAVVIEEQRVPARVGRSHADDTAIAATIGAAFAEALRKGGELGELREALMRIFDRLAFLATALPESGLSVPPDLARPDPSHDDKKMLDALCADAARGRSRFDELDALGARELVRSALSEDALRRLDRDAPEFIALPGRPRVRVEYPRGQPPFVASRMQDFFGLRDGPKLAGGRVALTLHLLAPNQRAVQVTQDLAGFWQRHYPALRRELSRRYPRHRWPEDPLSMIR